MDDLDQIRRQFAFRRRLDAARLSGPERFGLALLAVFLVFLAATFAGNREIAGIAAYALIYGGGAFALWSLVRDLRGAGLW